MANEALIDLLSSLSLKRRQGLLRASTPKLSFDVSFSDGKIVDVEQRDRRVTQDICARLWKSGVIHDKVFQLFRTASVNTAQLYDLLIGKKFVTADQFFRAKRATELDWLHSLGFLDDAAFEFVSREIRPDPRFSAALSPAQVLLDIVELQNDEERFQAMFGREQAGKTLVYRKGDRPRGLGTLESAVWDAIEETRRLEQLFQTLLSEYEIKEGLLALVDQELIGVELAGSPSSPPAVSVEATTDFDDMLLQPDMVENEPDMFDHIANSAVDSLMEGFSEDFALDEMADELDLPKPSVIAAPPKPMVTAEPVVVVVAAPVEEKLAEPTISIAPPTEPVIATHEHAETAPEIPSRENIFTLLRTFMRTSRAQGSETAFFELNHRFLEKEILDQAGIFVVLTFLAVLLINCLMENGMIATWFRALGEFSTATSSFML